MNIEIYYSCNNYPNNKVNCWCSRWDRDGWNVMIECIMTASQRNNIFNNVVPGAVRELMTILGEPTYIDTTYSSGNTLRVESSGSTTNYWDNTTIAVKNISDTFINREKFNVKIEGKIL